jgi:hypothetical protein
VLADDGELFAKIEAAFQVGNTRLSLTNYVEGRGGFQPPCETMFSHAGAHGAEEFEQTSFAEQVKVGCVDVVRIVELGALLTTGTGPAVFNASEALSVEVCCAVCAGSGATCVLVCDDEYSERGNAGEEPRGGERVPEEGEPSGDEDCCRQGEASRAEVVEDFV